LDRSAGNPPYEQEGPTVICRINGLVALIFFANLAGVGNSFEKIDAKFAMNTGPRILGQFMGMLEGIPEASVRDPPYHEYEYPL
jgi:hypothetical protein